MCANSGQKGKNDSEKAKKVDSIGIEITDFQTPDKTLDTVKCFRGIFKIHLTSCPVIL